MKRILLFFGIISFFLLSSCSDDNVSSTTKVLQPMSMNSYWIYENYDIDTNNVEKKNNTYDSTVVSGQKMLLGKLGNIFSTTTKDIGGNIINSSEYYLYEENQKLYMHSSRFNQSFSNFPNLPINLKEQWVKIADVNDDDWKAYEEEIPETDFLNFGKLSGKIVITGENKGKKDFSLNDKKMSSYEFYLNFSFNGSLKLQQSPIPINFNFEQKIYIRFVEGIGLVQQINQPTRFPLFNVALPGSKSLLIKYFIK